MTYGDTKFDLTWTSWEFDDLRQAIRDKRKASYQHIVVSHDDSIPASEKQRPVSSLKDAGIDAMKGVPGKCYVEAHLDNSYDDGDGLWVHYKGAPLDKFRDCRSQAAVDLLLLLLANRP